MGHDVVPALDPDQRHRIGAGEGGDAHARAREHDGAPHRDAAFVEHDAFQCGYCTPGQICSAVGMLGEVEAGWPSYVGRDVAAEPRLDAEEIRERMSGNICRCGAYPGIVAALQACANEKGSR